MNLLTPTLSRDTLPSKSPWEVATMRKWGGVSFDKRRGKFRVYIPWKGKREWIAQDRHGYKISCEDHAKDVLREIRLEHFKGSFDIAEWGKDKTILIENAWTVYQDQAQCGRLRHEQRQQQFDDMIIPYFKGKTLKDIEEHHLWDWFSKIPKQYAAPTAKGFLNTLRGFFNFYKITRQKAFKWSRVPLENKKQAWLVEDEQEKILEATPAHHKPIIRFLIQYGCRVSEACNLKRTDIDWGKRVLVFRDRKNMKDNELPLMESVEKDLVGGGEASAAFPSNQKQHETKGHPPTNLFYVFSTPTGKRYQRQHVGQIWEKACKKAGVKRISLKNGTRHSLASQLINRGVHVLPISIILGNSVRVVETNYANLTTKKVANILEGRDDNFLYSASRYDH